MIRLRFAFLTHSLFPLGGSVLGSGDASGAFAALFWCSLDHEPPQGSQTVL